MEKVAEVLPKSSESIPKVMSFIRETKSFITDQLKPVWAQASYDKDHLVIPVEVLTSLHPYLVRQFVAEICYQFDAEPSKVRRHHIMMIADCLILGNTAKKVDLPNQISAYRENGNLVVFKKNSTYEIALSFSLDANPILFEWPGFPETFLISLEKNSGQWRKTKPQDSFLNFDAFWRRELSFRPCNETDVFQPFGCDYKVKAIRYLKDKKIPRHLLQRLPLLFAGDDLVWVPKIQSSELCRISDHTEHILHILFKKNEKSTKENYE